MIASLIRYAEDLLPPILFRLYRRYVKKAGYFGSYHNWSDAVADSGGYDGSGILEAVREALGKVRDGELPYERDGVTFDEVQHAWPLLSGLLWAASQSENRLRVLDLGGSLGSSYFQNRHLLGHLDELRWSVVEQPHFVACGRNEFSDGTLSFYADLKECAATERPNLLLLSSVLPYVEQPYQLVKEIISLSVPFVIVDRTPVLQGGDDQLTVQRVPPEIYPASYPAWFLSRRKLLDLFASRYETVAEFDALAGIIHLDHTVAHDRGFIFRIRKQS